MEMSSRLLDKESCEVSLEFLKSREGYNWGP